jgi:hypothetical protein
MNKRKKIIIWITGTLGALLVVIFILLLTIPKLINSGPIREKVLAELSQMVGGKVAFQRVDLTFFPRPDVIIHEASLSIPEVTSGNLKVLHAYLKIGPLFKGRIQLSGLKIENPDFTVQLQAGPEKTTKDRKDFSFDVLEKDIPALVAPIISKVKGLVIQLEEGRLTLVEEGKTQFSFHDIHGGVDFSKIRPKMDVTCKSNLWENILVQASLDSRDFKGEGYIEVNHIRPHTLLQPIFADTNLSLADSEAHLTFSFKTDGFKDLSAEVEGSIPRLTIHQGTEKLVVKGKRLTGTLQMNADKTLATLTELKLDEPRLGVVGKLLMDHKGPLFRVEMESKDIDVHPIREGALAILGDDPVVQELFDIVRGGRVPSFALKAEGGSPVDLLEIENIDIKANLEKGTVFISESLTGIKGFSMDLKDCKGDAIISNGILTGENMQANFGNSQAYEGRMKVGLEGDPAPFHLDIQVNADVAEVPTILNILVDDESLKNEMKLINDLEGSATGRMVLGDTTDLVNVVLDVTEINMSARYGRLPYPLEINGGHFFFDEKKFRVRGLMGKMQNSTFSDLSAQVKLGKSPHLEIQSGSILVSLDENYTWLSSIEEFKETLKEIESVNGKVLISSIGLKGLIEEPKKWQFKLIGKVEKVTTISTRMPGPVVVTGGRIEVNQKSMSITRAQTSMLDAKLTVSGIQQGYLAEGIQNMDFSFHGNIGSEAARWISKLVDFPPNLRMQPPLSISEGKMGWNKSGTISLSGTLEKKNWPTVSIDMLVKPGELLIKKLTLQDEKSDATIDLNLKKGEFHLGFNGLLDKVTMDAILVENQVLTGHLQGDFEVHILRDRPKKSTAEGTLRGAGLGIPLYLSVPLSIDSFSLKAVKRQLEVKSTSITLADSHLNIEGKVGFLEETFQIDMTVSADELEWVELEQILNQEKRESESKNQSELGFPPIRGNLRIKLESFKYERMVLRPLYADARFEDDLISVTVDQAEFCGISTPGTIDITPAGLSLEFNPVSKDQRVNPIINCLRDQEYRMTGNFNLRGKVTAEGKEEALLQSLEGNLEMAAKEGLIFEDPAIEKIFAYLSGTKSLKGKLPKYREEGLPYDTISAKANLQNGRLVFEEGIFDGPTMHIAAQGEIDLRERKVDVRIVVSPLRTVDSVVSKIPLVNRILAGTLISVPIRVRGDLGNPTVTPLSPSMVGAGLLGIVKRTLTLPFDLVGATSSEEEEQADTESEK